MLIFSSNSHVLYVVKRVTLILENSFKLFVKFVLDNIDKRANSVIPTA